MKEAILHLKEIVVETLVNQLNTQEEAEVEPELLVLAAELEIQEA
jgi:hypothetical protein